MRPIPIASAALLLLGITSAGTTQAASVTYILDQSNSMADDIGYLQVKISDGVSGAIDFAVNMLEPLTATAGKKFGIQKFSFNLIPNANAEASNVTGLPEGWKARNGGRLDGFGQFDISLRGNGATRVDELNFSITGVDGDQLLDYVSLSTGNVDEEHAFFAAKVHGMAVAGSGSQATFGGFATAAAVVPAPAALWLLGSGLGLLGFVTRRKQTR